PHALHSFPTRRSSDLSARRFRYAPTCAGLSSVSTPFVRSIGERSTCPLLLTFRKSWRSSVRSIALAEDESGSVIPSGCCGSRARSEEHTSELQSRENL